MIKLVLTTVPGPGTDAQHPQGWIHVRGDMGVPGLISGLGKVWVGGSDLARLTAMKPGLAA